MLFEWIEDWSQLFQNCNWYTFRFCLIETEWDKMMGAIEGTFIIFGLGFRIRWQYTETEATRAIKEEINDLFSV